MLRRSLAPLLLLAACHPTPPPAPAAEIPAEPPAAVAEPVPAPATPPGPAPAVSLVRDATALQPGDTATALEAEGRTSIDPSATFRVVLAGRSQDARLALHDAADAVLPAASAAEIGETTVLTLSPTAPLVPGSRYQLRLDGAVTRELHVGERSFTPAVYALQATGDPPPPPRPQRKRSRH